MSKKFHSEVDLDSATTSVKYGEVDVAFGLDYLDAPMPGDKSIELVRLPPEEFAVAVATGSVDPPRPGDRVGTELLGDLDWILPPEGKQHIRNARKEMLMAARSVLDAAIERQEAGPAPRRTVNRVEID